MVVPMPVTAIYYYTGTELQDHNCKETENQNFSFHKIYLVIKTDQGSFTRQYFKIKNYTIRIMIFLFYQFVNLSIIN